MSKLESKSGGEGRSSLQSATKNMRWVARRVSKNFRTASEYFSHYVLLREQRRGNAEFFRRYPYRGALSLREVDSHTQVDVECGFLFHSIPKAANSVFTASLMRYSKGTAVSDGNHDSMKVARSAYRTPSTLRADEIPLVEGLFKFVVVRNPYSRLLSAYLSKVKPYTKERRRTAPRISTAMPPNWTSGAPSFAQFCQYLADGGLYYESHWAPQIDFLLFPLDQYDYICRNESLPADFEAVCTRIFGSSGPHMLLQEDKRHWTGATAKLDEYYTDELYDLVYRLYRDDFEAFEYLKASRVPEAMK